MCLHSPPAKEIPWIVDRMFLCSVHKLHLVRCGNRGDIFVRVLSSSFSSHFAFSSRQSTRSVHHSCNLYPVHKAVCMAMVERARMGTFRVGIADLTPATLNTSVGIFYLFYRYQCLQLLNDHSWWLNVGMVFRDRLHHSHGSISIEGFSRSLAAESLSWCSSCCRQTGARSASKIKVAATTKATEESSRVYASAWDCLRYLYRIRRATHRVGGDNHVIHPPKPHPFRLYLKLFQFAAWHTVC